MIISRKPASLNFSADPVAQSVRRSFECPDPRVLRRTSGEPDAPSAFRTRITPEIVPDQTLPGGLWQTPVPVHAAFAALVRVGFALGATFVLVEAMRF